MGSEVDLFAVNCSLSFRLFTLHPLNQVSDVLLLFVSFSSSRRSERLHLHRFRPRWILRTRTDLLP